MDIMDLSFVKWDTLDRWTTTCVLDRLATCTLLGNLTLFQGRADNIVGTFLPFRLTH